MAQLFYISHMANKSSKSPTGEDREERNEFIREQEIEKQDITDNSGIPKSKPDARQENLENRGYMEDQPGNPIRSSGSLKKEAESPPTGEPDSHGR
jgi:hypothetical protein